MEKQKLDQLTGWRFIAAFGVILCHFSNLLFPGQSETFLNIWKGMANFVGFFFILSGFILAYNYQAKMISGETSNRQFFVARLARIYPALAFSLLVALPAFLFINHRLNIPIQTQVSYMIGTILVIKTWLPFTSWGNISAWNGPIWSIETEFFFYLCFPFVIQPLSKLSFRSNLVAWGILAVLMVSIFGSYDLWAARINGEPFYGAFDLLHSSPYFCVLEFIFGIITFNIARELPDRTLDAMRKSAWWIFTLLVLTYVGLNTTLPMMSRFHGIPAIIFSLAILLSYSSPPSLRFLQSATFLYLGEISYSLYLLHIPVFILFTYASKAFKPLRTIQSNLSPLFAIAVICVTFGLAAFCMKFIEGPWRRRIRKALS